MGVIHAFFFLNCAASHTEQHLRDILVNTISRSRLISPLLSRDGRGLLFKNLG